MGNLTESKIIDAIHNIKDPDLGLTLKEMNSIDKIELDGDKPKIHLQIPQPIHWAAKSINEQCHEALKDVMEDREYEVLITELPEKEKEKKFLQGVRNIIAVASGKGGVGKSSISANLAAALAAEGARVGILDADIYGPSQPTMFDLQDAQLEAYQTDDGKTMALPVEKYGIKVASMGFAIKKDEAAIIRGPLLAGYFSMLFEQIDWGNLDFLVFDLPPGTGDIQLTLTQKIPLTGAIIVTTPQEISLADVRRGIAMFRKVNVDILGIVENMSYFVPPDMPDKKYYIFGEGGGKTIAAESNVNLLGEVPLDIEMRERNDSGKPVVISRPDSPQSVILKQIAAETVSSIRKLNYSKSSAEDLEINI